MTTLSARGKFKSDFHFNRVFYRISFTGGSNHGERRTRVVDIESIGHAVQVFSKNPPSTTFFFPDTFFSTFPNPLRDSCRIGGETLAVGGGAVHATDFFFFLTKAGSLTRHKTTHITRRIRAWADASLAQCYGDSQFRHTSSRSPLEDTRQVHLKLFPFRSRLRNSEIVLRT